MVEDIIFERFVFVDGGLAERLIALKESMEDAEGLDTCLDLDNRLNFSDSMNALVVASSHGDVVGISSIFAPRREEGEISVCVEAGFRRRGIGTALVTMALDELRLHHVDKALLVCDERSVDGKRFVESCGGVSLYHEYGMRFTGHAPVVALDGFSIRPAEYRDIERMAGICASAYGDPYDSSLAFITNSMDAVGRKGFVGLYHGRIVGLCFVGFHGDGMSLNTVAVDPDFQGRGFGKVMVSSVIDAVASSDLPLVLDVDSTNSVAFGLYRTLGFSVEKDIAYYGVDIHFPTKRG